MSFRFTLIYFDSPGRAEIARLIFAQAGVNYDDRRIPLEAWPQTKRKMPFGQVPLLRDNGRHLAQSNTIYRYLALEFGLAGKDDWERAECDSIVDAARDIWDFHKAWRLSTTEDVKMERKQLLVNEQLPNFFARVEKILKDNPTKSGWLVGDQLTWADIYMAHTAEKMALETPPFTTKAFPVVEEHMRKVKGQPRIKAYEDQRGELRTLPKSPHRPLPPN